MPPKDQALFDQAMQQALQASSANEGEAAIKLFYKAIEIDPRAAIPHFLLAAEYMEMGQIQEAEGAYANSILLAPNLHIARFQLGLLQFTSARASLAMLTWQPLMTSDAVEALKLFVQGFVALATDDFQQAISHMQEGMKINDSNPPLNRDMARVINDIQKLIDGFAAPTEETSNHVLLANYQKQGSLH